MLEQKIFFFSTHHNKMLKCILEEVWRESFSLSKKWTNLVITNEVNFVFQNFIRWRVEVQMEWLSAGLFLFSAFYSCSQTIHICFDDHHEVIMVFPPFSSFFIRNFLLLSHFTVFYFGSLKIDREDYLLNTL